MTVLVGVKSWYLLDRWQAWGAQRSGQLEFIESVRGERPAEARLSWEFHYAPWRGRRTNARLSRSRTEAEAEINLAARKTPSAETVAARGIVQLFRGRTDGAAHDLQFAVKRAPGNAALWSNLAAARLARAAEESGSAYDLVLALEAAYRATALNPVLPQAVFNHALALERLFLFDPARKLWRLYLRIDPDSPWAAEARSHLEAVAQPSAAEVWDRQREHLMAAAAHGETHEIASVVSHFSQESRCLVEENLLGEWAEATLHGRPTDAARALTLARRIAAALSSIAGEHMPKDAIATIDSAVADPPRLRTLAEGHNAFFQARNLYRNRRSGEVYRAFGRAHRALERGGSPVARWALLYLAIGKYENFELAEAIADLKRLIHEVLEDRYPSLRGSAGWMLGMARLAHGEPLASLEAYRMAVASLERTGAVEDIAGIHSLLAENLRYLGEERETWKHLYAALRLTPRIGDARRRQAIYGEFADACLAAGASTVARLFRDAAVQVAVTSREPVGAAHALILRSATLVRLGLPAAAAADLAVARHNLEQIVNPALRDRVEADLRISESELAAAADPANSATPLNDAISFYTRSGSRYPLGGLYLARSRARLAAGDEDGAEADLRAGIAEFELQRRRIPEERLQVSFFDRSGSLFKEMIRLQTKRGRSETAFNWSERSRARALLDRLGPLFSDRERRLLVKKAGASLTAAEVRRELPPDLTLLEYALLEDRLLTWVVRRESEIRLVDQPIAKSAVEERVRHLLAALRQGDEAFSRAATSLYDLLIRPALSQVPAGDAIVFVPDGILHAAPFAALIDRSTGRYLVQDRVTAIAPSATLCLESLQRTRELASSRRSSALVVGNPRFAREAGRGLPDLVWAEREAEAIAGILPSELLTGEQATRPQFLAQAGRHEIVHFAGHAIINQEYPFLSYLLMAPEGDSDSGVLYAHQIYGLHFERTRLVVLAACRTAYGRTTGEGALSLARAFLGGGVPTVIASLWDVGDQASAQLFRNFYRHLEAGEDPGAALRGAQLTAIASGKPVLRQPASWAGFQLIGGAAPPSILHRR